MKFEYEKIKNCRDLNQEEIDLINECEVLEAKCSEFVKKLKSIEFTDKRCVHSGKTNLKEGFEWAIRGITWPRSSSTNAEESND